MYSFLYRQNLCPDGFLTEANLDDVPHLHIVGCALWTVVHEYSACVAGFVRHRTTLDESRYFQVFV